MKKILRLFDKVPSVVKNKYSIAIIIFLTWMIFFDENNFILQFNRYAALQEAREKKEYFIEGIEANKKLQKLFTNKAFLEKFAREKYFMKKPDEEIYIIEYKD